jgi:hydroxypyruvate reductase 1
MAMISLGVRALRTFAARGFVSSSSKRPFSTAGGLDVEVYNPSGEKRVVVTKMLPGTRWLDVLTKKLGARVEVLTDERHAKTIVPNSAIIDLIGDKCDGVLGQLTEDWSAETFGALKKAGGVIYSNYAVGYNNVNVADATAANIAVGNTPGVLTETTAEITAALTLAAARRVVEADEFMRAGKYLGWLPDLFVGKLLQRGTLGLIGAGRIGSAYAKMMVEGHYMDLVYFDKFQNTKLEDYMKGYSDFLESQGEQGITCTRVDTVEEVLSVSDVVSLHPLLDKTTHHLINKERLSIMKEDAILVNAARGPVVDEVALVNHLQQNPNFRCGLDVFEDEPDMKPGLAECKNAVIVPHIASASQWTRGGMATLAACNISSFLQGHPGCDSPDMKPFVDGPFESMPKSCPSVVNLEDITR